MNSDRQTRSKIRRVFRVSERAKSPGRGLNIMTRPELRDRSLNFAITLGVLLSLALPAHLSAQMVGATVSGTVVDASGAVTPGVNISITNVATGVTSNAVTNGLGFYNVPNLLAGDYELTVSATGFTTLVRRGITLTVGQELVLNLT